MIWWFKSAFIITRLEQHFLVNGWNFHFSGFQRIIASFPVHPVNSSLGLRMGTSKIETIQIGIEAAVKPPTTLKELSAMPCIVIVILVVRAEHHVVVVGKAVTWAQNKTVILNLNRILACYHYRPIIFVSLNLNYWATGLVMWICRGQNIPDKMQMEYK